MSVQFYTGTSRSSVKGSALVVLDLDEWQTAIGCLIGAAEHRDFVMHSRIGVLRALNRNAERTLTDRNTHWGKRKLKREQ